MGWKQVLGIIFLLVVTVLLVLYWFFPFEEIKFNISNTGNSNFTLNNSLNSSMQFYDNMRYPGKDISYRIESCNLKKEDDMKTAFAILENLTALNFYPVSSKEEIHVTCDEKAKFEGSLFVAGEGGPINITRAENFNVIHNGAITLLRDSNCQKPNIAVHELLHALGFDHSENQNNIMYPVSKCSQQIGQDTLDTINLLYSFPSQPDLNFEGASASMKGRYLDVSFTVRNNGLNNSGQAEVIIYADNKSVKKISLEPIEIGAGRIVTLTNILVFQTSVSELKLRVVSDYEELDKENNEIMLKIKK